MVLALGGLFAPSLRAQTPSAYEELQTLSGVMNHVRTNYVDTVGYHELVRAAIDGVLHALDPHSAFYTRAEWERRTAMERGTLAVTGLALEAVDSTIIVLAVYPKSPAAKAGIMPGDRITAVNDTSVVGVDVEDLALRLAGDRGSKVRLRLERGPRFEPDSFAVTLKRDFVEVHAVSSARMADSVTGYIRLEAFGFKAADDLHQALKQLHGRHARQYILDLRGNPGGLVPEAVNIASEFFPKGTVVFRTKGRKRDVDTTYVTTHDGDFADVPLIVLINEHSASAAEALAASLQDHDRALLLGRRSFGKALMQRDFLVLPGGDDLHLTVGYVLSPSGRFIQRRYRGLGIQQYWAFAGRSGAAEDTVSVFRTDHGRPVRGGGGVEPDVEVARAADWPIWFTVAWDSGFVSAVADSVALVLPLTRATSAAWMGAQNEWRTKLLPPFLDRVRTRLHVEARVDSLLELRVSRILAARVAEVRWGADGLEEFWVRNDPGIASALTCFPRLPGLLAGPPK